MRRREAEEAVRMARFLTLLHRWESAELNQEEAAELLGVSERMVRRWTRRYERRARPDYWTAGSARRRASGFRLTGPKRWSGFIASVTRASRSSISTSISSRTMASAGATPG